MKNIIIFGLLLIAAPVCAGEHFDKMTSAEHLRYAKDAITKKAVVPAKMHLDAIAKQAKEYKEAQKLYKKIEEVNIRAERAQKTAQIKGTQQKQSNENNQVRAIAGITTIRNAVRNPDSFKLESGLIMQNGSVCYEYRTQNGFGGMNRLRAVMYGDNIKTSEMDGFGSKWNKYCAGKSGEDATAYLEMMALR